MFFASLSNTGLSGASYRIEPDIPSNLQIPIQDNLYLDIDFSKGVILTDDLLVLEVLQKDILLALRNNSRTVLIEPLIKLGLE